MLLSTRDFSAFALHVAKGMLNNVLETVVMEVRSPRLGKGEQGLLHQTIWHHDYDIIAGTQELFFRVTELMSSSWWRFTRDSSIDKSHRPTTMTVTRGVTVVAPNAAVRRNIHDAFLKPRSSSLPTGFQVLGRR